MEELAAKVRAAVPGEVLIQLDGEILHIDNGYCTAQFTDPVSDKIRQARIPLSQLASPEAGVPPVGALLTWTVFQRSENTHELVSRVRLRDEPPFDPDQLKRNAAALSFLADAS
jgi:hypothetical protein